MSTSRADAIMRRLADRRVELRGLGVRSLALFGSVARGSAGPQSDVDLLVEFDGPLTFDRYVDLEDYLERLLATKVDLITIGSLRPHVRDSLQRELRRVPGL